MTPLGTSGEYVVLSFSLAPLTLPKFFSRAECEVAAAIAIGCSNAAIARQRGTSVRTVENQIYGIFRKLGIGSRNELAAYLGGLPRQ
jgi:DNA-binding NarL/FixJ family response regulator